MTASPKNERPTAPRQVSVPRRANRAGASAAYMLCMKALYLFPNGAARSVPFKRIVSDRSLPAKDARFDASSWSRSTQYLARSHLRLKIRGRWLTDLNRQKECRCSGGSLRILTVSILSRLPKALLTAQPCSTVEHMEISTPNAQFIFPRHSTAHWSKKPSLVAHSC
jgi:hypothetical protein